MDPVWKCPACRGVPQRALWKVGVPRAAALPCAESTQSPPFQTSVSDSKTTAAPHTGCRPLVPLLQLAPVLRFCAPHVWVIFCVLCMPLVACQLPSPLPLPAWVFVRQLSDPNAKLFQFSQDNQLQSVALGFSGRTALLQYTVLNTATTGGSLTALRPMPLRLWVHVAITHVNNVATVSGGPAVRCPRGRSCVRCVCPLSRCSGGRH